MNAQVSMHPFHKLCWTSWIIQTLLILGLLVACGAKTNPLELPGAGGTPMVIFGTPAAEIRAGYMLTDLDQINKEAYEDITPFGNAQPLGLSEVIFAIQIPEYPSETISIEIISEAGQIEIPDGIWTTVRGLDTGLPTYSRRIAAPDGVIPDGDYLTKVYFDDVLAAELNWSDGKKKIYE